VGRATQITIENAGRNVMVGRLNRTTLSGDHDLDLPILAGYAICPTRKPGLCAKAHDAGTLEVCMALLAGLDNNSLLR
jgi:hypothetical protein